MTRVLPDAAATPPVPPQEAAPMWGAAFRADLAGPPTTAPAPTPPATATPAPAPSDSAPAGRWRRLWRGHGDDPAWARPALLGLLLATAVLYLWDLGSSGWANAYYSAAAQAGAESWKAWFFGSFDAANAITVDKPPASLWVMGLSARLFGVNAWSILVPQALMGVASVGVLYAAVRRWHGAAAGLIAGAALALTPVAVLMFRFNNPDALLVLLLTIAAYAVVRATEKASTRWLLLAGVLIGFGFLTKMLQAFLVVPGFALVYLLAANTSLPRRLLQLVYAGIALVVSSAWWIAVVELWPADSRPYIGGSQTNSMVELLLGYNGLGRITGNEAGSVVPGGASPQGGMWGETGLTRLFNSSYGGQASWLVPAALLLMVALLVLAGRASRTDRLRASAVLWGSWLVVTGLVISLSQGIIHEYYTVALAPAIGALVGIGSVELWRRREHAAARLTLAGTVAVTAVWAWVLLGRAADWQPWLRPTLLLVGLASAVGLAVVTVLPRRAGLVIAGAGLAVALAAPVAYSVQTAATPHSGSLPSAGPSVAGGRGGPGGGPGALGRTGPGGQAMGQPPGLPGQGGAGQLPGLPRQGGAGGGAAGGGAAGGGATGGGTAGGLLGASTPSAELTALLRAGADRYTWAAAAVGANSAAGYQLASGEPVLAIGGFNGSDPWPTLAQFQQFVAEGQVHYFIAGGMSGGGGPGAGPGGYGTGSEISTWVSENFTATTVGAITVYDLTAPTATGSAAGDSGASTSAA